MRRITLSVLSLSLVGALAWLATRGPAGVTSASIEVEKSSAARPWLAFREGEAWQLHVDYRATTRAAPLGADGGAGGSVSGEAALVGALDVHAVRVHDGVARLALSVLRCDEARVRVLDRDLLAGAEDCAQALAGELVVDVDARGALLGMAASAGTPTLGTRVLEALALELFAPLPRQSDAPETLRDTTPRGAHDVTVAAIEASGGFDLSFSADGPLVESRLPAADAHVRSSAALTLRAGRIASLRVQESVDGVGLEARTQLHAQLASVHAHAAKPALLTLALGPAFQTSEQAQEHALASQRIAGLTAPEVLSAVSLANAGGTAGDHSRFMWRATALVKQDPALARALADAASREDVTTRGRALCLDLLAQAGSPDAESALLDALASDAARADKHHAVHVQRVSLLEAPSARAADAVLSALARERTPRIRGAWLATAGAVSALVQDEARRTQLHEALTDALAEDGEVREAALLGIGNSGAPALAERAEVFLSHENASVRNAAITAITDGKHPRLANRLADAAQDKASLVQRSALRALDRGFAREGVDAVVLAIDTDRLRRDNVRVALEVLKHHGHEDTERARAVLERLVQDDRLAAEERAAARSLMDALARGAWGG